ncbi:MAG TPA: glycosyltransferase family 4 protein [bacterium]|nr:glycosyltransferase family 4 protein [bacterium]HPN32180.1 glycosyltransferase family 4 protein [bacterium]
MSSIAVLCPGFGVIPRGIETVVKETFFGLAKKNSGLKIDIYCGADVFPEPVPENIKLKKIKLPEFDAFFSKLYSKTAKRLKFPASEKFDYNFMMFALKLAPKLFKIKYDIIFNNAGIFSAYICNIYRKLYKKPYIHSGHAGINNLEYALARLMPDVYIASTEPAKLWIESKVERLKCETIPNGINPNLFFPASIDETKIGLDRKLKRPVYLFVGALTNQKQPDKILRAFIENNIGSLIIIGNGELKNKILEMSKNNNICRENFIFIDNVDYNKLPDYFNFCDYFVMPSLNETFGIVYIMAIACNKPVISDDKPQQKWMLENAGIYCKAEDYNSIKRAMLEITQKDFKNYPLIRSENFHWKNIVKQYEQLISKLT